MKIRNCKNIACPAILKINVSKIIRKAGFKFKLLRLLGIPLQNITEGEKHPLASHFLSLLHFLPMPDSKWGFMCWHVDFGASSAGCIYPLQVLVVQVSLMTRQTPGRGLHQSWKWTWTIRKGYPGSKEPRTDLVICSELSSTSPLDRWSPNPRKSISRPGLA